MQETFHSDPYQDDFGGSGVSFGVVLAIVLLLVGGWFAYSGFRTMADRIGELQTISGAGGVVTLTEGTHTVYFQPQGGTDVTPRPNAHAFAREFVLHDANRVEQPENIRGFELQIRTPSFDGWFMLDVAVPRDGRYAVRAPDPQSGVGPGVVSIGPDIFGTDFRTVIETIGALALMVASGIGLIIAATRRKKRRKQISEAPEGFERPPEPDTSSF